MEKPNEIADRYVALWSEPDPEIRRKAVVELWTEDAVHLVQPTEEMVATATGLGMSASLEAVGHAVLETRLTHAYEEFIAPGKYRFQRHGEAARLRNVVKLRWEMIVIETGEVAGLGTDVLTLAADGRIQLDYQFIDG